MQTCDILGVSYADTDLFAVAIMDSELSMPCMQPVPLKKVGLIWRSRTPSEIY